MNPSIRLKSHFALLLIFISFTVNSGVACVEIPDIIDPPAQEPPDAGTANLPDAGDRDSGIPQPDAGDLGNDGGSIDAGTADTTRPTVLTTFPLNESTQVKLDTKIRVAFSEPMNRPTVSMSIQPPVKGINLTWDTQDSEATLTFTNLLKENTRYTLTIEGEDRAANALENPKSFFFTTGGPAPDMQPPTILATTPADSKIGVNRDTLIEVVFSEPMSKPETEAAFAVISPAGLNNSTMTWNPAATVLTVRLAAAPPYGSQVVWQVSTHARDAVGNMLEQTKQQGFRIVREGVATFDFDPATSGSVGAPSYYRPNFIYNLATLGDTAENESKRLFLGFLVSGLPEDLTLIRQATLRWWTSAQQGNPHENLGHLMLEHVNIGNELEASHFGDNPALIADYHALSLNSAIIVPPNTIGRPGTVDITSWFQSDWLLRNERNHRTQYRLRFSSQTDGDNISDILISDVETDPKLATLEILYEYP
ncbi:Ig-like domain-containing protein [Myxococcus stipitatus]|uniref:Ig-like domain-containing protein n=1 Tax=Myxococcus stipitatus TaxID=83455 RepID=UPI001F1B50BF|nr:Ig-like domain-containing protein [Myxococcus stipitatus]MCE9672802.1 Ig-like domain-containing protein [Myxococcus stipitatus]